MEGYFFGTESMVGKKVKLFIKDGQKRIKKEAVIIHDNPNLFVVKYIDWGWCEAFNHADVATGTVEVQF